MTFHILGYGRVLATRRLAVQVSVDGLRQPQEYTIRAVGRSLIQWIRP